MNPYLEKQDNGREGKLNRRTDEQRILNDEVVSSISPFLP
jgi:hypothetical protein